MKIKTLALKNIRSYRDTEIQFPDGILLFEGDIGSGKSTLLYAIEFALFGGADVETKKMADFYLRVGEDKGFVNLTIEVNGKEYQVYREIKRKGSGICKIYSDSGYTEYAPSEMKKRVLEILGFNEPSGALASSVIFRYAIFTPQEEMKEILKRGEEDKRIQTLRKAFRIEDYKIAKENAITVARDFRGRASFIDDVDREMKQSEKYRDESERKISFLMTDIENDEKAFEESRSELGNMEKQVREIELKREKYERLQNEIEKQKARLVEMKRWLASEQQEIEAMDGDERRLNDLEPLVKEDEIGKAHLEELEERIQQREKLKEQIAGLEKEKQLLEERNADSKKKNKVLVEIRAIIESLQKTLEEKNSVEGRVKTLRSNQDRIQERIEQADEKINEFENERDGYVSLKPGKKCPKCGQELSAPHIHKLLKDVENKLQEIYGERKELNRKAAMVEGKLGDGTKKLNELEGNNDELNDLEGQERTLNKVLSEREDDDRIIKGITKDLEKIRTQLAEMDLDKEFLRLQKGRTGRELRLAEFTTLKKRLEERALKKVRSEERRKELAGIDNYIVGLDKVLKEIDYNETTHIKLKEESNEKQRSVQNLESIIPIKKRNLDDLREGLEKLTFDIEEKKRKLSALEFFRAAAAWLSEFFGPALEAIEQHVLSQINYQFEELFRKWFAMLVEGTELEVTVDENFAPIVNQGGYELDIWALSGGEKTAVAFAYRLALNHMVREVVGADTGNLLILDEPTDGFSTEQLSKVREVLRELRAPQLILVSHERELEGFADHIFRVVKENGVSRIEPVNA
jgi:exonuclease SbcC